MGLITPGYLTGLYHPDRYFMADYHPEWGYPSELGGDASVTDPFSADVVISGLESSPGITDTLNSEMNLQ